MMWWLAVVQHIALGKVSMHEMIAYDVVLVKNKLMMVVNVGNDCAYYDACVK